MGMDLDESVVREVLESFDELHGEVEIALDRVGSGDLGSLDALFRAIHSIKGNAAMIQMDSIVRFTHSIEDVIESLRAESLAPSALIIEALELGMDRLRDLHYRELLEHTFDKLHEKELEEIFFEMSRVSDEAAEACCMRVFDLLGAGFALREPDPDEPVSAELVCYSIPHGQDKTGFDLTFFKELAHQVDRQSRNWDGRSDQLHDWAQKVNSIGGSPVDSMQLSAATYLHDIGMSFVPNQILDKQDKLTEVELKEIRQHPIWGYNFLVRMEGWNAAATIILEHHEYVDGNGYPHGNTGDVIHDGAKILSIIDAFFSITNERADRSKRRSTVRAVSEINARTGTQFDKKWVDAFNEMLKTEIRRGVL